MVTYENLNEQNQKITELSNILSVLLKDRLLCDSDTCNRLFFEYVDDVMAHMHEIDSNWYIDLLRHSSQDIKNVANNFMSGSQEIKRIMNRYNKKWCSKGKRELVIGAEHSEFLKETSVMFDMVLKRLQDEMEHLYPAVRKINEQ